MARRAIRSAEELENIGFLTLGNTRREIKNKASESLKAYNSAVNRVRIAAQLDLTGVASTDRKLIADAVMDVDVAYTKGNVYAQNKTDGVKAVPADAKAAAACATPA